MTIDRFIVRFNQPEPRFADYLTDAHVLGFVGLQGLECQDLYFIECQLSQESCWRLALELLSDSVTQSV